MFCLTPDLILNQTFKMHKAVVHILSCFHTLSNLERWHGNQITPETDKNNTVTVDRFCRWLPPARWPLMIISLTRDVHSLLHSHQMSTLYRPWLWYQHRIAREVEPYWFVHCKRPSSKLTYNGRNLRWFTFQQTNWKKRRKKMSSSRTDPFCDWCLTGAPG